MKILAAIGNILLKEILYRNYRFYFIVDRYKIKLILASELKDLLIKFVRMSPKNVEQQTIEEIKHVLRHLVQKDSHLANNKVLGALF